MNRTAVLVFAAVMLFVSIPCAHSQVLCPTYRHGAIGADPDRGLDCDSSMQCVAACCLTSGRCPKFSCKRSLGLSSDRGTKCKGTCAENATCVPTNPACPDDPENPVCIGSVHCLTPGCADRVEGDLCVISSHSTATKPLFKVCHNGS